MSDARAASVFLVDDDPFVRKGFHRVFGETDEFTIADAACSGEEALQKIAAVEADVAVVDLRMEDMGGIELTRTLKETYPNIPVLVLSMYSTQDEIEGAFDAGADGYVLKNKAPDVILEAIGTVLEGHYYLCNEVRDKLAQWTSERNGLPLQ